MNVTIRQADNVPIVDLSGRIILGDGDVQMRQAVQDLLDQGKIKILLNMDRVTFMDSSGIGELVACHKRVVERSGVMKILKPNKRVLDLFTITRLIQLFDVFDDEKEALKSFERG